jgi:predicted dehydrogenase
MNTGTKLRTVVIGFGKIGAGYANDPLMARYYRYVTHAQVLAAHPAFSWEAVVDTSESVLEIARVKWKVPYTATRLEDLPADFKPDVAIIATPPDTRLPILEQLPTLRGLLVEKPLGNTLAEANAFLDRCNERNIPVQVNYWRRADDAFRNLANGGLEELIGKQQAVFGVYGNGLLNNGSHMVDFVRMLCGAIEAVSAIGGIQPFPGSPVPGDLNFPFTLRLSSGIAAMMQPLRVEHFRENGLDLWGEKARLSILLSGLGIMLYPCKENRAMMHERELAVDEPRMLETTIGDALYRMYDNLAAAVLNGDALCSPGSSALKTARVVQAVFESVQRNGEMVEVER